MNKKAQIDPDKINLFQINLLESAIKDLPQKGVYNFNIKLAHTTMHNLQDQRIKIGLFIDLEHHEKSVDAQAHFVFDFHFQIEELNNFYELKDDNIPNFSGLLIATLLGISYSTARGIIYEKLLNTNMKGIILPVVSPQKMLVENRKQH